MKNYLVVGALALVCIANQSNVDTGGRGQGIDISKKVDFCQAENVATGGVHLPKDGKKVDYASSNLMRLAVDVETGGTLPSGPGEEA